MLKLIVICFSLYCLWYLIGLLYAIVRVGLVVANVPVLKFAHVSEGAMFEHSATIPAIMHHMYKTERLPELWKYSHDTCVTMPQHKMRYEFKFWLVFNTPFLFDFIQLFIWFTQDRCQYQRIYWRKIFMVSINLWFISLRHSAYRCFQIFYLTYIWWSVFGLRCRMPDIVEYFSVSTCANIISDYHAFWCFQRCYVRRSWSSIVSPYYSQPKKVSFIAIFASTRKSYSCIIGTIIIGYSSILQ